MRRLMVGRNAGVTLVELLVVMGILGVVVAAIAAIWFSSSRAFQTGDAIAQAQANARRAMGTLERDMRSASRASVDVTVDRDGDGLPDENALAFATYLPDETVLTDVVYYVDEEARLIRESGGAMRSLASNVIALDASTATAEYAIVELIVSVRGREASLRTQVVFRNP